MRLLLLTALAIVIGLSSCGSDDDLPACIDEILTDFRVEACEGSGELTTWNFKGELVYCFAWGACLPDQFVEIYDAECNLVCELGGIGGLTICDGTDWATSAELEDTIYSK